MREVFGKTKSARVSGNSGPLWLGGASGGAPVGFDPASLFGAGDSGWVIDPSVESSRLNDSLVAATPGQAVRRCTSTYNLGDVLDQSASTRRPLYQVDAGKHYWDFDGVDDYMGLFGSGGWFQMGSKDAVTIAAAVRRRQNVNLEDIYGHGTNPVGTAGGFNLSSTYDASSDTAGFAIRGSGAVSAARASGVSVGADTVLLGYGDISTDTSVIRRDGVQVGSSSTDQGTGNSNSGIIYIGCRGGTSRFFNGRLYAMVAIDRLLTAGEMASVETWLGSRCGLTI